MRIRPDPYITPEDEWEAHYRATPNCVQNLDEIEALYNGGRSGRHGGVEVECYWCKRRSSRVVLAGALRWYLTHPPCHRPEQAKARLRSPEIEPLTPKHEFALTERRLLDKWRVMETLLLAVDAVYRGGHRHGLERMTTARIQHEEHVDQILVRILGGVPVGKPTTAAPLAKVIRFPVERRRDVPVAA